MIEGVTEEVVSNSLEKAGEIVDLYRLTEKSIKAFARKVECSLADSAKPAKKKSKTADDALDSSGLVPAFGWPDVIDPHTESPIGASGSLELVNSSVLCLSERPHACTSASTAIFRLARYPPGLFIIREALCSTEQHYWASKSLAEYSKQEHTNLTNLARKIEEPPEEGRDIWERSCADGDGFLLFQRLRWACLGYHYDWTHRCYQRDDKSLFPEDCSLLCKGIAKAVGQDFEPEAAIVNYYPATSSMGGHLDDAEHNMSKPIVSLSFGRSALFLIGGRTKEVAPSPILVRGGDAVVMTGESRLCFHGVPCILSAGAEELLTGCPSREEDPHLARDSVTLYLKRNRLNLNVRQVRMEAEDGGEWLDKAGSGASYL